MLFHLGISLCRHCHNGAFGVRSPYFYPYSSAFSYTYIHQLPIFINTLKL